MKIEMQCKNMDITYKRSELWVALTVTSAKRMGRYNLSTNLRSTETVSFKVGPEGALLLPGDVCLIGDPLKTRIESGGRVASATTTAITVDRDLTSGVNYGSSKWYLYTYTSAGLAERSRVQSVSGSRL